MINLQARNEHEQLQMMPGRNENEDLQRVLRRARRPGIIPSGNTRE